jgi:hypothetical protein
VIYEVKTVMIHSQVQSRRVLVFFAIGLVLSLLVMPVLSGKEPPKLASPRHGNGIPGKCYYKTPNAPADSTLKKAD